MYLTPIVSNYLDISSAVDSLSICKICFCSLLLYRERYRLEKCLIWLLCILYNAAWEQAWNKINKYNENTFKRLPTIHFNTSYEFRIFTMEFIMFKVVLEEIF